MIEQKTRPAIPGCAIEASDGVQSLRIEFVGPIGRTVRVIDLATGEVLTGIRSIKFQADALGSAVLQIEAYPGL